MSWLFPLYALGALAIAAPIIFHLFQRRPHGKQEFSSLMFLRQSPPKLTRRSNLSDLLLLLLRGGVLLLLAAAFARPFLRSSSLLDINAPSRSVALLVDTSASMRRDGMWDQLQRSIERVVNDLRPTDQVMLVRFDRQPETLVSFEAWEETLATQRIPFLREQLASLQPTWHATDVSSAMIEAGDALLQQRLVEDNNQPLHAIVFTDLQEGSDLSGLQTYQWPDDIAVDLRTVTAKQKSNASLQSLPPEASELDSTQVRVLVRNEGDSDRGQFELQWQIPDAQPVSVYVPPGQSRVVRVTQPPDAVHLKLSGDDHDFDNSLYLAETERQKQKLWYIGDDNENDDVEGKKSLYFYLRQCSFDTRTREVTLERPDLALLPLVNPKECPLIIVSRTLTGDVASSLQKYAARGGQVLVIANPPAEGGDEVIQQNEFLQTLLGVEGVTVSGRDTQDYAMLAKIDFQHPLFQPFADPRFSDFTGIHFWSHGVLESSEEEPWRVVAGFDDRTPALVEKNVGDGTVWVLTSGWNSDDSQLALSTKFVPLMHGFFGRTDVVDIPATWEIGQAIAITPVEDESIVIAPNNELFSLEPSTSKFEGAFEPGIYQLKQGDEVATLAVNLSADESRTKSMLPDRLEQLGLTLGEKRSVEAIAQEQRLMRNKELEGSQKLWRLGILFALAFVAIETWLGGRTAGPALSSA